ETAQTPFLLEEGRGRERAPSLRSSADKSNRRGCTCGRRSRSRTPEALHLPKQVRVRVGDQQGFGPRLQLEQHAPAEVAGDTGDGGGIDQGRAVDLPELARIELVD